MGYSDTQRRTLSISVNGGAYDERDLIGVAYVIEQGTKLRKPVSEVNPSMYRCAKTVPAPAFAERGSCNPDYDSTMKLAGGTPTTLPFALETESAKSLQARLTAGTLSSETLMKAYLSRIALTNAEGPALQAVRMINTDAVEQAKLMDRERASSRRPRPAARPARAARRHDRRARPADHGRLDRAAEVDAGLRRRAGRQAQGGGRDHPRQDQRHRAQRAASTPTSPRATPRSAARCSCRRTRTRPWPAPRPARAASTAEGLAALTFGLETSTDTAQIIAPAGVAGVVALKPTVGAVSTDGVLAVAKAQDAVGPITRTVADAATALGALTGKTYALPTSLAGKKVAYINSTTAPFPAALTALHGRGRDDDHQDGGDALAEPGEHRHPLVREGPQRLPRRHVRRRGLAAGHRQLQHRPPGRGPEVPAA